MPGAFVLAYLPVAFQQIGCAGNLREQPSASEILEFSRIGNFEEDKPLEILLQAHHDIALYILKLKLRPGELLLPHDRSSLIFTLYECMVAARSASELRKRSSRPEGVQKR
jgi:hypothetical protein